MQRFVIWGVCLWVGCGVSTDPVKGYTQIWESNCDAVSRCEAQAPEEDWAWADQRLTECMAAPQIDEIWASTLRDAVDTGRVFYDRSIAKQCIKENKSILCDSFWETQDEYSCNDVLVGQVGCGEACTIHQECGSGVCRGNLCDCGI